VFLRSIKDGAKLETFAQRSQVRLWRAGDNCYQKVEIGDSVVKNKGSFDFLIYNSSGTETVNIQDNLIIPK
jgi:hypothetical protein